MISGQLSRNEYRTLIEHVPIMIWRANTTAQCDYFNERWLQFRGRTLEEEYGNQWTEGVHPGDFKRCFDTYLAAFEKRQPFEMQYRLKRHDGDYRWILDRGAPSFGRKDEFLGYLGSCIDITDRMEAQRALEQVRDRELAHLRGILPVCMECKRIQQADGTWLQMELYIRDHSRADFSHGLCPSCYAAYYKEVPRSQGLSSNCGRSRNELEKEVNDARHAATDARECYKRADAQFRDLTARAYDVGLNHPDGVTAMNTANRNLNNALQDYQEAVKRMAKLLSQIPESVRLNAR